MCVGQLTVIVLKSLETLLQRSTIAQQHRAWGCWGLLPPTWPPRPRSASSAAGCSSAAPSSWRASNPGPGSWADVCRKSQFRSSSQHEYLKRELHKVSDGVEWSARLLYCWEVVGSDPASSSIIRCHLIHRCIWMMNVLASAGTWLKGTKQRLGPSENIFSYHHRTKIRSVKD